MANIAYILFFDELNDFLTQEMKFHQIAHRFGDKPSIKNVIEAHGIPHTEVGEIKANDQHVGFDYIVMNNDHIKVFPYSIENRGSIINPTYVLDNHLGKLTVYLRILGFDTLYDARYNDNELAEIAHNTNRILLTRDRRLLMRSIIKWGYCVRSHDPQQQLVEVIDRYDLGKRIQPFNRCLCCNHPLESIQKEEVLHRLQPLTQKYYTKFCICKGCDRIYWKGSHYKHMIELLSKLELINTWEVNDD